MKNPFHEGVEDGKQADDAGSEAGDTSGSSEESPTVEGGDGRDDAGDNALADLFVAENDIPDTEKQTVEGSDEPLMKVSTFQKRIDKIIAQREDAKRELATAEQELASTSGERDGLKQILTDMRAKYKDNPKLALWDAAFMDRLEAEAAADPALQAVTKKIAEHLEGTGDLTTGSNITMTDVKTATEAAEANLNRETADRIDSLIKSQTRTLVQTTLEGVKQPFVDIIADHIVNTSEKLEGLSRADVVNLSKKFLTDKGLKQEDVLAAPTGEEDPADKGNSEGKAKGKAEKGEKPGTGGTSGKAAVVAKEGPKESGKSDEIPPQPKTLEDFETQKAARRRELFSEPNFQD
ncbi:MAG: hypothetical protein ACYTFQ_00085 [Planctomycetota bacterium]|jgi:hypothetical protein